MINTLFLTTVAVEYTFVAFFQHSQTCPRPSVPFFHISLKKSALKTSHNTFRDCRVHFFRQPFSKQLHKTCSRERCREQKVILFQNYKAPTAPSFFSVMPFRRLGNIILQTIKFPFAKLSPQFLLCMKKPVCLQSIVIKFKLPCVVAFAFFVLFGFVLLFVCFVVILLCDNFFCVLLWAIFFFFFHSLLNY